MDKGSVFLHWQASRYQYNVVHSTEIGIFVIVHRVGRFRMLIFPTKSLVKMSMLLSPLANKETRFVRDNVLLFQLDNPNDMDV